VTETRWLDEQERRAWRGFLTMHAQLTARLHRRLHTEFGLSLADFDVLVHLTDRPEERARVLELAESLHWEKSRLSHHLARMQRRGLVDREECPDDARGSFVVLTDAGRAALTRAAPPHVDAVRALMLDELTAEQVGVLAEVSERVLARLRATS